MQNICIARMWVMQKPRSGIPRRIPLRCNSIAAAMVVEFPTLR